jgi:hypothetical protein
MMTNQQLGVVWGQLLGMGHEAALRGLYMLGYAAGAGVSVDLNLPDVTRTAAVPTMATVTAITTNAKIKKPD